VALIIGGEAGGAGQEAESLAGGAVQIPMPGGMESLNAAVAAGVLLFEVVRQRSSPAGSRERPAPAPG
jgi:TrmH family RNA methyltransferase